MQTFTTKPSSITLDVETDDAYSLRRRLQARPENFTTAILPGGALLEDGPEATNYHFPTSGEWTTVSDHDGLTMVNSAGHTLTIREGRVQLTLVK